MDSKAVARFIVLVAGNIIPQAPGTAFGTAAMQKVTEIKLLLAPESAIRAGFPVLVPGFGIEMAICIKRYDNLIALG